jgi:hypothetical protein
MTFLFGSKEDLKAKLFQHSKLLNRNLFRFLENMKKKNSNY